MTTYQWTSDGMVPDDWTQKAGSVSADYVKLVDVEAELDALRAERDAQAERIVNLKFDMNLVGAQLGISKREEVEPAVRALLQRAEKAEAEARALAYMGEHHFHDLTWKHRCEELLIELAEARARLAVPVWQQLRAALVGLVGADSREELEQMEVAMRLMPAPAADKAATIDAIHALIATLPLPPPPAADGEKGV